MSLNRVYVFGRAWANSSSHLVNDGVEESPPSEERTHGEGSSELFTNLAGANVGFKNWHPTAVTGNSDRPAGQSEMGGVWEWTSTTLTKHDGFEPMPLYPAYTGKSNRRGSECVSNLRVADFFDDKHNIVLGGSWATHPRIAGRKSL